VSGCNSTSSPKSKNGGGRATGGCVANCSADSPYEKKYATAEEAAVAAMQEANPRSHASNREIGGWIQENPDGTFTPRRPVTGTHDGLTNMPSPQSDDVAWWHTHGAYDPNYASEQFSGLDGDMGYSNATNRPGYVATPSGKMMRYDPSSGNVTTLPQTTARDPTAPR